MTAGGLETLLIPLFLCHHEISDEGSGAGQS